MAHSQKFLSLFFLQSRFPSLLLFPFSVPTPSPHFSITLNFLVFCNSSQLEKYNSGKVMVPVIQSRTNTENTIRSLAFCHCSQCTKLTQLRFQTIWNTQKLAIRFIHSTRMGGLVKPVMVALWHCDPNNFWSFLLLEWIGLNNWHS